MYLRSPKLTIRSKNRSQQKNETQRGVGVLVVYMTGRSDVLCGVENLLPRYFVGSSDLSRIFFFFGLKYVSFNKSVLGYLSLVFFWVAKF